MAQFDKFYLPVPRRRKMKQITKNLNSPFILSKTKLETLSILSKVPAPTFSCEIDNISPVVIGSQAAKYWIPSFRKPVDWDIIATAAQVSAWLKSLPKHPQKCDLIYYPFADSNSETVSGILKLHVEYVYKHSEGDMLCSEFEIVTGPLNNIVVKTLEVKPIEIINKNYDSYNSYDSDSYEKMTFVPRVIPNLSDPMAPASTKSSSQLVLEYCASSINEDYMLLPPVSTKVRIPTVEVLEMLKASHIYWPAYFSKHIADLHTFRSLLEGPGLGFRASKSEPLKSPNRDVNLQQILTLRRKETEKFRGVPGSHINLNMTNEDFLDGNDDLFVERRIPHDDIHNLVKYFDVPIYDTMKKDHTKAMMSKAMFESAPYDVQLKCVREECMAIALERYLIPRLAFDQQSAYKSALMRVCTTLTKGWFRDFAIDNYPRVAVCDKDLMIIAADVLKQNPVSVKKSNPEDLLRIWISELEDLVVLQKLIEGTTVGKFDMKNMEVSENVVNDDNDENWEDEVEEEDFTPDTMEMDEQGLRIVSPVDPGVELRVLYTNQFFLTPDECNPSAAWCASIAVVSSLDLPKDKKIKNHPYTFPDDYELKYGETDERHVLTLSVHAHTSGGSWGGEDVWTDDEVVAKSMNWFAETLKVDGLTGPLLMKYILAWLQPRLIGNGETPLKTVVNEAKVQGALEINGRQHLWFELWKLAGGSD